MKTRGRDFGSFIHGIALKFDRHISSSASVVPFKFQNDRTILNTNLAASRLCRILRQYMLSDIETRPSGHSADSIKWVKGADVVQTAF